MSTARFVLIVLTAASSAFAQELPTVKVLTLDLAQTIAQEAMAKCRADGFKVTVKVVDAANIEKLFLRDDGAPLGTIEFANLKANSAMAFGRPSGPPPNQPPGAPTMPAILPGTINAAGGLPIKVGDQVIGAVAVSGGPNGAKDAACASAGLAKVADRLK